jgi:hypothetical protein
MALTIRNTEEAVREALVASFNAMRRDSVVVGTRFHADCTADTTGPFRAPVATTVAVTSANATDLPTLVTLTVEIRAKYIRHGADANAHKVADAANVIAAAVPTDLATCITALNEVKADYNIHRASTTYHYTADATNTVTSADATDLASSITLANEIKADLTAHIASAPAGSMIALSAC